jgi:hypothetical protein
VPSRGISTGRECPHAAPIPSPDPRMPSSRCASPSPGLPAPRHRLPSPSCGSWTRSPAAPSSSSARVRPAPRRGRLPRWPCRRHPSPGRAHPPPAALPWSAHGVTGRPVALTGPTGAVTSIPVALPRATAALTRRPITVTFLLVAVTCSPRPVDEARPPSPGTPSASAAPRSPRPGAPAPSSGRGRRHRARHRPHPGHGRASPGPGRGHRMPRRAHRARGRSHGPAVALTWGAVALTRCMRGIGAGVTDSRGSCRGSRPRRSPPGRRGGASGAGRRIRRNVGKAGGAFLTWLCPRRAPANEEGVRAGGRRADRVARDRGASSTGSARRRPGACPQAYLQEQALRRP